MTKKETALILAGLQVNYPENFRGKSEEVMDATVELWSKDFSDDPYPVVQTAIISYIQSSTDRFMPNIGMIREEIRKLTAEPEMTGQEAWALVARALRNSGYGYREEYAKLPPVIQRAVGSANQLHEWALMDAEEVQTVVSSNFQRSYRAIAENQKEIDKLPAGYREQIRELAGGFLKPLALEEGETQHEQF